ncbi:MAG TPA: tail fiber domain-containing protein [Kiritimatiellia bacterium]|nr:tail fiber domain-containing protein [Kiritimatiellia bacterium]
MATWRERLVLLVVSAGTLLPSVHLLAQPPALINYQGRLINGTNLVNGTVTLTFRIHTNATGGNLIYEATNLAVVADGLYATQFGDAMATTNTTLSLNQALNRGGLSAQLWLEVAVNGTNLSPRERLLAVPYARQTYGLYADFNNIILGSANRGDAIPDFSQRSAIGGGGDNRMFGSYVDNSVIAGGWQNVIDMGFGGQDGTISGGRGNALVESEGGTVGGGITNRIISAIGASIGGGATNRVLESPYAVIGGGSRNTISNSSRHATIAGGDFNRIFANASHGAVGGGLNNVIQNNASYATIAGGQNNQVGIGSGSSFIGGGSFNVITSTVQYSVIGGGAGNNLGLFSSSSTIGGGWLNVIGSNSPFAVIGGGEINSISNISSYAVIVGGTDNRIGQNASRATIVGGAGNRIANVSAYSVIAGGLNNQVLGDVQYAAIAGGRGNEIGVDADDAAIIGGQNNRINGEAFGAAILGGYFNLVSNLAYQAVVVGGYSNRAAAQNSFAAGTRAHANHAGSFVWGDFSPTNVNSTAINQTTFRSTGGFRIFTSVAQTSGVTLAANSGSWSTISDVNAKEGFASVDTREVLERVAALPITTWRYKGQDAEIRHIGPTAQDFYRAFGVGDAPGYGITAVDADGVALAAIQALASEVRDQRSDVGGRMAELEEENRVLREELEAIKRKLGM